MDRRRQVLLHLVHEDPYPILDFRALWSIGLSARPTYYSVELWSWYVDCCRKIASTESVTMRTLDQALWQYSAEHQPPQGTKA